MVLLRGIIINILTVAMAPPLLEVFIPHLHHRVHRVRCLLLFFNLLLLLLRLLLCLRIVITHIIRYIIPNEITSTTLLLRICIHWLIHEFLLRFDLHIIRNNPETFFIMYFFFSLFFVLFLVILGKLGVVLSFNSRFPIPPPHPLLPMWVVLSYYLLQLYTINKKICIVQIPVLLKRYYYYYIILNDLHRSREHFFFFFPWEMPIRNGKSSGSCFVNRIPIINNNIHQYFFSHEISTQRSRASCEVFWFCTFFLGNLRDTKPTIIFFFFFQKKNNVICYAPSFFLWCYHF